MESTPRTAFVLQIHKNPNQVNKFIQQLISDGCADVYIHIDQKNHKSLIDKIINNPKVKIINQSINCEWGDISQVDATILLLREVLNSNNNYDFVCLRSGQDLLIKEGFKDFLIKNKNKIFIKQSPINKEHLGFVQIKWPKVARRRYTTTHPLRIFRKLLLYLFSKGIKILRNNKYFPESYLFYKGSQWFTVPFDVVKYMVEFIDQNSWFYSYFQNSLVPDESFFHTLIMNSPYKTKVVNDNLMFIKWGENLGDRNSPQDLTMVDIKELEDSNKFFARKFDEDIDQSVVGYFSEKVKFDKRALEKKVEEFII